MLGITSQFLGYLLISLSLPRLPAVVTSIILLAQPVVTVGARDGSAWRVAVDRRSWRASGS